MAVLGDISKVMQESQSTMKSEIFMKALSALSQAKDNVREEMQKVTSDRIREIIGKLEGNDPLTRGDLEYMKLWLVGDAEGYTAMENNFGDWLKEFERLKRVLTGYENKDLSVGNLLKLHGILEDALRLSADIANFLEKKERIEKFKAATKDTASLDREILKHILESKLKSPQI